MISAIPSCKCRQLHEDGFTLIELLIALTIMSFVAVLLFGGLRFGTRAWEHSRADGKSGSEINIAQEFLHHAIETAYPLLITRDPTHPRIDFDGASDGLRFLAPLPKSLGTGRMARYSIGLAIRSGHQSLIVTWRQDLPMSDGSSAPPQETVLVPSVSRLTIAYFGALDRTGASDWHSDWSGQVILPDAIRISADLEPAGERPWPELIVVPRITVDAGCVFDPLTKNCRGR